MQKKIPVYVKGMLPDVGTSVQLKEYALENKDIRLFFNKQHNLEIVNEIGDRQIANIGGTHKIEYMFMYNKDLYIITVDGMFINFYILYYRNRVPEEGYYIRRDTFINRNPINYSWFTPINDNDNIFEFILNKDAYRDNFFIFNENSLPIVVDLKRKSSSQWEDYEHVFSPNHHDMYYPEIHVFKVFGGGLFPAGTIQYFITNILEDGQETTILNCSYLFEIGFFDTGAAPDQNVNCSFKINLNSRFQNSMYRIYSVLHTSVNTTPIVKHLIDIKDTPTLDNPVRLTYIIDNGQIGEIIDPLTLFHVGGRPLTIKTVTIKAGTLFGGNIRIKQLIITQEFKQRLRNTFYIEFDSTRRIHYKDKYASLDAKRFFKTYNIYTMGIQFLDAYSYWTEPIFLNIAQNNILINVINNDVIEVGTASINQKSNVENPVTLEEIRRMGIQGFRFVYVPQSPTERHVLCQGIICPTVYNIRDRYYNAPFAQSSWSTRAYAPLHPESANRPANHPWLPWTGRQDEKLNQNIEREVQCSSRSNFNIKPIGDLPSETTINDEATTFVTDWSIVTFHSPDIDLDERLRNMDLTGYEVHCIGYTFIDYANIDIDIQTSTAIRVDSEISDKPKGFFKRKKRLKGLNAMFGLTGYWGWHDWIEERTTNNMYMRYWEICPWQRIGSLNNCTEKKDGIFPSLLKTKKMSTYEHCEQNRYFTFWQNSGEDYIWHSGEGNNPAIASLECYDKDKRNLIKLHNPFTGKKDAMYKGFVDTAYINKSGSKFTCADGHIFNSGTVFTNIDDISNSTLCKDPVPMQYESSSHYVLNFHVREFYDEDHNHQGNFLQPFVQPFHCNHYENEGRDGEHLYTQEKFASDQRYYLDKEWALRGVTSPAFTVAENPQKGFVWIAEIFKIADNINEDIDETYLQDKEWIPCSTFYSLEYGHGSFENCHAISGDVYYTRHEHLKTYAASPDQVNCVTNVISFDCETYMNPYGRYDKNKELNSHLVTTPNNFNLYNNTYNQPNNFFKYRILPETVKQNVWLKNAVIWSKPLQPGNVVHSWTQINTNSILYLPTDEEIVALINFNDNILAFTFNNIYKILYNERVQIATKENVPIEISNNNKVTGWQLISDKYGTFNKHTICISFKALYFIETKTGHLIRFTSDFEDLSSKYNFCTFFETNKNTLKIIYDEYMQEVLISASEISLAFSEVLNSFTSYYSRHGINTILPVDLKIYYARLSKTLKGVLYATDQEIYLMRADTYLPGYTTLLINPEYDKEKIFSTLEFHSDNTTEELPIQSIKVTTPYQTNTLTLTYNPYKISNTKKKFDFWRVQLPRGINNKDRLRGAWMKIKLQLYGGRISIINNINIYYFD